MDILFMKWISIHRYLGSICGYLGSIWDIYMPSIIPQLLATDPSHGPCDTDAPKSQPSMSRCLLLSSPAGGAGMGPAGAGPGSQGANHWGSPSPDRQWPYTNVPAVIRRCDSRQGAGTTLSWSSDGGRTGKKSISVAYRQEYQRAYFRSTGRGNGATGVHQSIL